MAFLIFSNHNVIMNTSYTKRYLTIKGLEVLLLHIFELFFVYYLEKSLTINILPIFS